MKRSIALLTVVLAAGNAQANCLDREWLQQKPMIPAGETASFNLMYETQTAVVQFIKEGEQVLKCLKSDSAHNGMLFVLKKLASNYNSELRSHKKASVMNSLATN